MKNKGKILAMDFGEKTVGLAITDEEQTMVFGRGVIKNFGSLQKLAEKLKQLCDEERVVKIIMGLPFVYSQERKLSQRQVERMRNIGEKLRNFLSGLILEFQDESFSSFEAGELLGEIGVKGLNLKKNEDEAAAVIILHRYLEGLRK